MRKDHSVRASANAAAGNATRQKTARETREKALKIDGMVGVLWVCSIRKTLVFDTRIVTEVDEQAEFVTRCFEVVDDLRSVLVCEQSYSLQFDDDLPVANKVRFVMLLQWTLPIGQR